MKWEEGICLTGRPGSGKSTIIRHLMRENPTEGFLWFTVKSDEKDIAAEIADPKKLIILEPGCGHSFNPLAYEMGRVGGSALNLASILSDLNEIITRADKKGEAFWETNFLTATMHAINMIWMTRGAEGSLSDVYHLLMTTPENMTAKETESWKNSACAVILRTARDRYPGDRRVLTAANFFVKRFPRLGIRSGERLFHRLRTFCCRLLSRHFWR